MLCKVSILHLNNLYELGNGRLRSKMANSRAVYCHSQNVHLTHAYALCASLAGELAGRPLFYLLDYYTGEIGVLAIIHVILAVYFRFIKVLSLQTYVTMHVM